MSCLPGMPCYGSVHATYPRGCGIDPCHVHKTSTDLVFYTGPNLPCINIGTCDNTSLALQKIDNLICPENMALAIMSAISTNTSLRNIFCNLVTGCIPTTTSTSTLFPPVTTTTSSSSSTSTSTSSTSSSTSSTSTSSLPCSTYSINNEGAGAVTINYTNCSGVPSQILGLRVGRTIQMCAVTGSIVNQPDVTIIPINSVCNPYSQVSVNNTSVASVRINTITLSSLTVVFGTPYPIGPSTSTNTLFANGNYVLSVNITGSSLGQSISVIDSNSVVQCLGIIGDGNYVFPINVALDDSISFSSDFTITLRDTPC
jgi:hypothetical protein